MRDIEKAVAEGNDRAILALEMYSYRIKKYIGAYAAAMGGLDAVVFTAGVGEHQWDVRWEACKALEFLGRHVRTRDGISERRTTTLRKEDAPRDGCILFLFSVITTREKERRGPTSRP